jgi:hypothetical protein
MRARTTAWKLCFDYDRGGHLTEPARIPRAPRWLAILILATGRLRLRIQLWLGADATTATLHIILSEEIE